MLFRESEQKRIPVIKKQLPNLITLSNLLCGCIAVMYILANQVEIALYWVVAGIAFDFFDGLAARLLGVQGELGKQLDSLADMVTSGLVPGLAMYGMHKYIADDIPWSDMMSVSVITPELGGGLLAMSGLLITLASCYRLAKFNIDERQGDSFIGLPTPANAILILSLALIQQTTEVSWLMDVLGTTWVLLLITLLSSYLLIAELPLFALKFKTWGVKANGLRYGFIALSVLLLVGFRLYALPIIIGLYVLVSLGQMVARKGN